MYHPGGGGGKNAQGLMHVLIFSGKGDISWPFVSGGFSRESVWKGPSVVPRFHFFFLLLYLVSQYANALWKMSSIGNEEPLKICMRYKCTHIVWVSSNSLRNLEKGIFEGIFYLHGMSSTNTCTYWSQVSLKPYPKLNIYCLLWYFRF